METQNNAIHPKTLAAVSYGTVGGAIALIFVWILNKYFNADIPDEIAQAIGTLFTVGVGFVGSWRTASPAPKGVEPTGGQTPEPPTHN